MDEEERVERRLAAILAADVVNYSKLIGLDELGTHTAFKAHRRELIDSKIAEHQGRIVKHTGDGMLAEFASVVNAVACATEIQRKMHERNAGVPENRRLEFRIGINLDEVIVEDEDIFGDGVNVAARLESVARPGGIAVSGPVRDNVVNRLALAFEDMGEMSLKNIERPIRVFGVRLENDSPPEPSPSPAARSAERAAPPSASPFAGFLFQAGETVSFGKGPSSSTFTFTTLGNELKRRVFQYTFSGPLLLAWSLGLVAFIVVFERPLFGLIWSAAMVAIGFLMAVDYLRKPKAQQGLVRAIVRRRFRADELSDLSLKTAVEQQVNVLTEIALKIFQIERARGPDVHLRRLIDLTHRMISLLWDSAREAEELERGLKLVKGAKNRGGSADGAKMKGRATAGRRQESAEDIRRQIQQARSSVGNIVQHLEAVMLKVFQIEQLPGDPVWNSELARETAEIAAKLQRAAESRRADRYVSAEVQETREVLESGFLQIDSADGLSVLQRLVYEYVQVQPLLERRRATDPITVSQVPHLIEETYRVGLGLLEDALEVMRAARPSERQRLEAEVRELQQKIGNLKTDPAQQERVTRMDATLRSHRERLDIMGKQQVRAEELLHLSGSCEASMHRTRMELAALKSADSEVSVRQATETLRKTIDQAKDVQEELKRLGF